MRWTLLWVPVFPTKFKFNLCLNLWYSIIRDLKDKCKRENPPVVYISCFRKVFNTCLLFKDFHGMSWKTYTFCPPWEKSEDFLAVSDYALYCDHWCICSNCRNNVTTDFKCFTMSSSSKSFRVLLNYLHYHNFYIFHYLCEIFPFFLTNSGVSHFFRSISNCIFFPIFLWITTDTSNWLTLFCLAWNPGSILENLFLELNHRVC